MSTKSRNGFTLIEVLIVIAIIGILAGLILGGVMMVRSRGPELKTRNDILQLSTAMSKFYAKYNFYPPNNLKLCSNRAAYGTTQLDSQSVAAIEKMFPNISWTNINWGNRTPAPTTNVTDLLEGDQCLVFFLGGIPNGANKPPLGFSMNPANPATAGGDRLKFMDFEANRIVVRSGVFPSYQDGFQKQPYVYFSSMSLQRRENAYDPTAISGLGVSPYAQQAGPPVKYYKSTEYQIISAGNDGVFGPGGLWPANSPPACKDDMSNFNSSKLGAPD